MRRQKWEAFRNTKIDAKRSTPLQLCRSIDTLMGRGRAPITDGVGADDMQHFCAIKVASVRTSTSD